MRHSIRIRLALIFVIVILLLTALITFINIRMALERLQKDLQAESGKALNHAGDVIIETAKRVNNIAALLADTGEVKDSLKSGNIQEWLNAKQELWFVFIVEIFDKNKELKGRSFSSGTAAESFFTSSDDPIIEKTLELEENSDYMLTGKGIAFKTFLPVVNMATLETLGLVIVSFPFNLEFLQTVKEQVKAEITLQWDREGKIVSTIQDQKGNRLERLWDTALCDLGKAETYCTDDFVRGTERIGSDLYATGYRSLKDRAGNIVAVLSVAVNSSAIEQSRQDTLRAGFISSVIGFVLAIGVGFLTARSFTKPLEHLLGVIRSMSAGDLEQRADIRQNDEIGELAWAFNEMADELEEKQNSLRKAEEKYRGIFQNAVEGIYQTTGDGKVLNANPAIAKIMGYDSEQEAAASVSDLSDQVYVNPEDRREFIRILKTQGMVKNFETQFYRKDRTPIWVSLSARTVCNAEGDVLHIEGILTDITERIEKEKAFREREIAEAARKKVMDSIHCAKRIQSSVLPNMEEVKTYLPRSFFIWEPRDIVGGDLFHVEVLSDGIVVAVTDCTGHGVPGAFMTMLSSSGLRRIIRTEKCRDPAEILKRLNFIVKTSLQQDTDHASSDDGLDAGICFIEAAGKHYSRLIFAGAKLSLYYVHQREINIVRGDKQSIGYRDSDLDFDFTNHTVDIESGMCFYLVTDGFTDQLGGEKRVSFGKKKLRELLLNIAQEPFDRQRHSIIKVLAQHQGKNERQDDVTVVGFGF